MSFIIVLIGAVGFYRLPQGWFTPSFQEALNSTVGPVQLVTPEIKMGWGGWRNPLGIKVNHVTIKKVENDLRLEIPSLLISLKFIPLLMGRAEVGRCSFESAEILLKNQMVGVISVKAKMQREMIRLQAVFKEINPTALSHMVGGQAQPETSPFLLKGKLILEGGATVGLKTLDLQCDSPGGLLSIPSIYPIPLKVDEARLRLVGTGRTVSLHHAFLKHGNAQLLVKGTIESPLSWQQLYTQGGKLTLALEGEGSSIAIDDLNVLWPHGLSPKPRHWVVTNLSNGVADHLTTKMQGLIEFEPAGKLARFEVPEIGGDIHARGITVNYFGKLPPVVNAQGVCRFTREQFMIDAVGVANDVELKKAQIVIHDLHVEDQKIDIDLNLEGPIRKSLEIINAEPLFLAKKLDLDPGRISGHAATSVQLTFPLEEDVSLDLVNVAAHSDLKDGKIVYETKINGKPIQLDKGTFALTATRKALEMKGTATIQDVATKIHWREHFQDQNIPFRRQFILDAPFDLAQLKRFGIDASDYLEGKSLANIQYTVDRHEGGLLEGRFDLKSATMVSPILFWQKEQGKAATFNIKIRRMGADTPFFLDEAFLDAPDLHLAATGSTSTQGTHVEVNRLQFGNNNLTASILQDRQGLVQSTVRGKVLDISHVLDDSTPEPLIKPREEKDLGDEAEFKVKLNLDEVRIGASNAIHKVTGDMIYRGNTLYRANLGGKAPHNDQPISLKVDPLSQDRQQFTLESGDGGHLLEMLGADYELEGGQLEIKGSKVKKKGKSPHQDSSESNSNGWEIFGQISLENFTINKAPLLARLLSAASLQGIVNFFSGRGIHFHDGTADFSLTEASLILKKVRLISPSLGLLLEGSIDRQRHKVNFSGELIPLYIFNTVLARVPLLGALVSGGKDDGIFMTQFTLTGDRKDPELAINPITSVTPGLVREIFSPQGAKAHNTVEGEASKEASQDAKP